MRNLIGHQDIPLKNIKVKGRFWSRYQNLVREEVIPYQWRALNDMIEDAEPSHAIKNFRIAAGLDTGEFSGLFFRDSDLAKWFEAVGYSLEVNPDEALEALADEAIDLVEKAQQPDGYLDTYFTLKEPGKRWDNLLECHELYCAGHMIEAAVAYYKGTGKRKLLDIACRFADYIDSVFGAKPGQIRGYGGHQEIELALVKLFEVTGNQRYLTLAEYFIDERGQEPNYFQAELKRRGYFSEWTEKVEPAWDLKYNQAHLPVREQTDAVGHAVRAVYMYAAMADIAAASGDESLLEACRRLFKSIVYKQMYITGGIGATSDGEAITFDYDLPNDTIYQETCASIGLIFFAHNMLKLESLGIYADVLERALYNSVLSGMALDGKSFFYVNPLEVWPEACAKNPDKSHVKPVRQKWFDCPCCPTNISRLISSLGRYIYSVQGNTVHTDLYIGSEGLIQVGESKVRLVQETNYPWDGDVRIHVTETDGSKFTIALRIPGWCKNAVISVNNETLNYKNDNGYAYITKNWQEGDTLTLCMEMPVELMEANPLVRADAGKVAIQRGPLVYCLEEVDNGQNLSALSIRQDVTLRAEFDPDLLGGMVVIKGNALRTKMDGWGNILYRRQDRHDEAVEIKAVPYCLWGNRKQGEMLVWIREK